MIGPLFLLVTLATPASPDAEAWLSRLELPKLFNVSVSTSPLAFERMVPFERYGLGFPAEPAERVRDAKERLEAGEPPARLLHQAATGYAGLEESDRAWKTLMTSFQAYEAELAAEPDDFDLHMSFGLGLQMAGDWSGEPLFFEKRWSGDAEVGSVWFEEYEDADKPVNRQRRAALDELGACVYRAHSNWDLAPEIGVVDSLISILDLGPVVERGTFTTVHDVPPITVGRLASRVRSRLATGPIRVLGDLDREVRRVGTLIGGLGQMFNAPEQLVRLGADVIVAGECLAYTLRNAQEHGLALMEAGHCACENPGMRAMADWLSQTLSPIPVRFIDSGEPWTVFDG